MNSISLIFFIIIINICQSKFDTLNDLVTENINTDSTFQMILNTVDVDASGSKTDTTDSIVYESTASNYIPTIETSTINEPDEYKYMIENGNNNHCSISLALISSALFIISYI